MNALSAYLMFGAAWIGICVLAGGIQIRSHGLHPLAVLAIMVTVWPYLMFRLVRNVLVGNPNGSIWP